MQTRRAFVTVDHGRPTATTHQLNCAESLRTRTFRVTPPRELCDLSLVICPCLLIDLTKSLLSEAAEHGAQPEEVQLDFDCAQKNLRNYRTWLRILRPVDTAAADVKDFGDALKEGRINPTDVAKATQQHKTARDSINSTALPEEFASEFADYHRGAFAYDQGKEHWDEARNAWEDLLKRPEQDRHYYRAALRGFVRLTN